MLRRALAFLAAAGLTLGAAAWPPIDSAPHGALDGRAWGGTARYDPWRLGAALPWYRSGGIAAADVEGAWLAIGAASSTAARADLTGNGNTLATTGTAPSWSSTTGWTMTGAAAFNTGIVPLEGWSLVVAVAGVTAAAAADAGGAQADPARWYLRARDSATDRRIGGYGSVATVVSGGMSSGVLALAYPSLYQNGAAIATLTGTWAALGRTAYLGGSNRNTGATLLSGRLLGAAIYSRPLSAAEVAAVSAALASEAGL